MVDSLRLYGLGGTVQVRVSGSAAPVLRSTLEHAWSRCLAPADTTPTRDAGAVDVVLGCPESLRRVMALTTQRITRALIRAQIGRLLMFHAGAVSHPTTGRSLVFVAAGGTGKTTMCRLLGRHYGYLSDETVAVDQQGRILPYPKPLSLRRDGAELPKLEASPDELRLAVPRTAASVGRLVVLRRMPTEESGLPALQEMSLMDALVALAPQTSSLRRLDRPLDRLASAIDDTGPVLTVRYTEAASVADDLLSLIGARP